MFKHVSLGKHIELKPARELGNVTIRRSKKVMNYFQRYKQAFN